MLAERPEAREVAKPLITPTREGGQLNIAPVVSPDGKYVAFLSELSRMDIELWLADARTGELIRRLRKGSAFDPHYQSLLYINSAGTFSPDGKQFAFSAQRGEHDVLVIINVSNGDVVREEALPEVSEINTPTWSPDGRTIVVAGTFGGVSDLYSFDLSTGQTTRLTNDLYAEMHPAFSPDGRSIAFATDQGGGTDLRTLTYHGYRLAVMDAAGGNVRVVPNTETGRNINPAWTRDGNGIYFISDRGGIPNIYRVVLGSGELFQVTRLFGGVSGITALSPAISVARDTDRLLFAAYERGGYNIYSLTTAQELAGTAVTPETQVATLSTPTTPVVAPLPAQLPPVPRPDQSPFNRVLSYLHDPSTGLVTPELASGWQVTPYRPRLALDYLGQPQVGVAIGGVGGQGGLYGGISGIFSDLLGYHTLYGTVAAQGQFDEFGFQTIYINQKNRWNWGLSAQRIPYVSVFATQPSPQIFEIIRQRIFDTGLQGIVQYPFSPVTRIEGSAGLRRLSTDRQITDYNLATGTIDRFTDPGSSMGFNMAQGSVALVHDAALFSYTSPFAGDRYRFELSPTVGQLRYLQALADYRRYQYLKPFTFAVSGLHFGRYGTNDTAEQLFYPIFLGENSLVRGYYNNYSDCYNGNSRCNPDVLNSSFGTRVLVAKAELRFPLIRALVVGPIGFPPIEGFGFFDAGTAWDKGTSPSFTRGVPADPSERGILTSAGVGARVNILGYIILEADYVKAFELDRGWRWQFALQPGW
jgi:Tol biopolymer transport system component